MTAVFLDTVGVLAVWDRADQWHESATRVFDGLVRSRCPLVTTSLVFLECGNAAARTPYQGWVDALRRVFVAEERRAAGGRGCAATLVRAVGARQPGLLRNPCLPAAIQRQIENVVNGRR